MAFCSVDDCVYLLTLARYIYGTIYSHSLHVTSQLSCIFYCTVQMIDSAVQVVHFLVQMTACTVQKVDSLVQMTVCTVQMTDYRAAVQMQTALYRGQTGVLHRADGTEFGAFYEEPVMKEFIPEG